MNILIAPDSFKDCLSAVEVASHIKKGLLRAVPTLNIRLLPLADGGEGFANTMLDALGGTTVSCQVLDPLMRPITATYIMLAGNTAVIEMAEASGIERLNAEVRNPLITSSYGTGQLIKHAVNSGAKKLIIGIGGSATNDGGVGMAKALGYRFLDKENKELAKGGGALSNLDKIDNTKVMPAIKELDVAVACDVTNTLCGVHGASVVYAPQKGASREDIELLDRNLNHFATKIKEQLGKTILDLEGGGAAGGLGAGLFAFLDASLRSGFDIVKEETKLVDAIREAQLVITGEGKMDDQTMAGKVPWGVAQLAAKYELPVIGIAGQLGDNYCKLYSEGFTSLLALYNGTTSLEHCIHNAPKLLEDTAEQAMRKFLQTYI